MSYIGNDLATDQVFLPDGVGAVSRTIPSKLKDTVSVKDFGAVGDGVADDTAAIQAAINFAGTICFPPGFYLISSRLEVISKRRCIYGFGATIVESSRLPEVIYLENAGDSIIDGLNLLGKDTLTNFAQDPPISVNYFFIHVLNSPRVNLSNIAAKNKRCLVRLNGSSDDSNVINWNLQGFGGNSNFITGVFLSGPLRCSVSNGSVTSHGSAVLSGSPTFKTVISSIRGIDLADNGVYISTGDYSTVTDCYFENVAGSGIKLRGSFNKATSNTVVNCLVGITVTGTGNVPDQYGANGNTIVVANNVIHSCRGYPIGVTGIEGYFARDVVITGNNITNSSTDGGGNALTITVVTGLVFSNNIVDNSKGTTNAVEIAGTPTGIIKNFQICNNTISNSTSRGIILAYAEDGVVMGNNGYGNGDVLIEGRFTKNIVYSGNSCLDDPVLRFGSAYTNPNNVFFGNRGDIQAAAAVADSSLVLPNYGSTFFQTAITATPKAAGAVTIYNGIAYAAIDVNSSADWKQIS